ncbi:MAG TPA: DUF1732 domain-containing protein, partial [Candidatus Cloacimonadota bacterium]|nr:DUF1732 domain-containing protein [Candidatus Cloacimonadota bacterium]
NSRFLDLRTYLPRELNFFEFALRKIVTAKLNRGAVDVRINLSDHREPRLQLNLVKLHKYHDIIKLAMLETGQQGSVPIDLLMNEPGVIENTAGLDSDELLSALLPEAIDEALSRVEESQKQEGKDIQLVLSDSLGKIAAALDEVETRIAPYRTELFDNMHRRIKELLAAFKIDNIEQRLVQELAIYIDKYDIQEEITRLRSHIDTFRQTINKPDSLDIGKNLNFIMQEMQREANTLGSKFSTPESFQYILIIKEEIEKCREIIQNVA